MKNIAVKYSPRKAGSRLRFIPISKYLQLLFVVLLSIYFYTDLTFGEHIQDYAFISMRYAENIASGNGLVFNVGERKEGFTSPLYVVLLGFAGLLKFNSVFSVVRIFFNHRGHKESRRIISSNETVHKYFHVVLSR